MHVFDKLDDDSFQGRDNQIANLQEEVKQRKGIITEIDSQCKSII